jgi:23S rRNA (cytosine1962-C5)-methyltransferase
MQSIVLKPEKEIPVKNKHHWIFSGGVKDQPRIFENGEIVEVYSSRKEFLGHAFLNKGTVIAARMVNFNRENPLDSIRSNIVNAINFRANYFDNNNTNAYRLVNSEGDYLPGLTIDRYNNIAVVQISTTGMDRIKTLIVDAIKEAFKINELDLKMIYEKSTMSSRRVEGLPSSEGVLWGEDISSLRVIENGLTFEVDIKNSQKTGLFLDMREMRKLVGDISANKKVLNCFSYTGGFSLYAARGGALKVDSVDIAKDAVEDSKTNFKINELDISNHGFYGEDAFKFLDRESLDYDLVILDPPAFAKKKSDVENAKKGYYQLNKIALSKMKSNSYLLTCSCSYHVRYDDFEKIIMKAVRDSGKSARIIQKQRLAPDHPINLFNTEVDYLKSLLLFIH